MVEVEAKRGGFVGVLAGFALLLLAGAMVATEHLRAMGVFSEATHSASREPLPLSPLAEASGSEVRRLLSRRLTESLKEEYEKTSSSGSIGKSSGSSSGSFKGSGSGSLFKGNNKQYSSAFPFGSYFGGWGVQALLVLCYALCYKQKVVDKIKPLPTQNRQYDHDFPYGVLDCVKDVNMCVMVICCPYVRTAHTNHAAGVCGFWPTLCSMACTAICCGMGPCCLNVYFRIHLKDHLGLEDHCFNDLVLAFCCLPCITGQQALSVDYLGGYTVKCPCDIEIWGLQGEAFSGTVNTGIAQAEQMFQKSGFS